MTRSRRGLAAWLTGSTTPLFVLDERHVVLVFNQGCEQLSGWTAAEVIGHSCVFQSSAVAQDPAGLLGQLCPPAAVATGYITASVVIPHRNGNPLPRTIHFFQLPPQDSDESTHILGLILEQSSATTLPSSHGELSRHLLELSGRFGLDRLIALSPAMRRAAARVELARNSQASVHFLGETGTGREHLARMVHTARGNGARFIPLRCATATHFELQRTLRRLLEETPDADSPVTVYLDQVDRLPSDLQGLVLDNAHRSGWRWMSSSAIELETGAEAPLDPALAAELTTLVIPVPRLRDRGEDLPLLAQQLIEETNLPGDRQVEEITPAALRLFQQYNWPGNVDELAGVLQEAVRRCAGHMVDVGDLPLAFQAGFSAQQLRPLAASISLDAQLEAFEREQIKQALAAARGNKSLAADRLGIPRPKLYRRLESLGLLEGDIDPQSPNS